MSVGRGCLVQDAPKATLRFSSSLGSTEVNTAVIPMTAMQESERIQTAARKDAQGRVMVTETRLGASSSPLPAACGHPGKHTQP